MAVVRRSRVCADMFTQPANAASPSWTWLSLASPVRSEAFKEAWGETRVLSMGTTSEGRMSTWDPTGISSTKVDISTLSLITLALYGVREREREWDGVMG